MECERKMIVMQMMDSSISIGTVLDWNSNRLGDQSEANHIYDNYNFSQKECVWVSRMKSTLNRSGVCVNSAFYSSDYSLSVRLLSTLSIYHFNIKAYKFAVSTYQLDTRT